MNPNPKENWWNQTCGPREILIIALPLVASTISHTLMQFCDRLFMTWYSNEALAAALPAGIVSWTMSSLPFGIASYGTTFVAQYFGAEKRHQIGAIVWQAIWLGLAAIPIYFLIGLLGERMFLMLGHSPSLANLEGEYFLALSLGTGAMILDAGISAFFVGRGKTMVVMVVNIAAAILNVVLDYIFIFGWGPIPEMGLWGAGIATSLATWFKVVVFAILFFQTRYAEFGTRTDYRFDWQLTKRFLSFGVPNGIQYLIEGMAITCFVVIIAKVSETAAAASSVVFSINMLVLYPVFGIGIACSTLVGQKIGERDPAMAQRATWNTLWIAMLYSCPFVLAYFLVPELFLSAHQIEGNNFEEIKSLTIAFLQFVAIYSLFDTVQIVFVSAIKGAGDTKFVVLATFVTSALFLTVGFYGASRFSDSAGQVNWWWICLTGWVCLLSGVYLVRFLQGKWKSMSVLERSL
ncbi:MAG: MATE family multidrug resistance protein [Mariniblastus sp.]|jgi:MATE family multidrug resistance protein